MRIHKSVRIASAILALGLTATACSSDTPGSTETPDENTSSSDPTTQNPGGGAGTLAQVLERGELKCGVAGTLAGFSLDDNGSYSGLDVDYCRAVAAALFGDADKVSYTNLTAETRFTSLQSGDVDVLIRNGTWTASRDGSLGLQWTATTYYDGQGLLVRSDSGITDVSGLDNSSICVQRGTTTELNLESYFSDRNLSYEPVNVASEVEAEANFDNETCDAYTTDRSGLASFKLTYKGSDVSILSDVMSKEPLGPAVRQGDEEWFDIIQWTVFATFQAEEFGLTSANVEGFDASDKAAIQKFLDSKDADVGLNFPRDGWTVDVIKAVGNYQEIFDRNIAPLGLDEGYNQLYLQGGLHYAPPF